MIEYFHSSFSSAIRMGPDSNLICSYCICYFLRLYQSCATEPDLKISRMIMPKLHVKLEAA